MVLAGLEWPSWSGPLFAGLGCAPVPLSFVATLWSGPIRDWIADCERRLLGEAGPVSAARSRR
jgi:hypothetical protein